MSETFKVDPMTRIAPSFIVRKKQKDDSNPKQQHGNKQKRKQPSQATDKGDDEEGQEQIHIDEIV